MSLKEGNGRDENRVPLYKVVPLAVPFAIGIGINDYCNFKCVYCGQSITPPPSYLSDKRMISWDEFRFMIDNIEELYEYGEARAKNFGICGIGEPTMHKLLPEMVKYCSDHKICDRIELTTNGSLLTHALSEKLIDAGLTRLLISVQGVTGDKYKKICGYNLDFDKFVDEIKYFYEHRGKCKVYLKTVDVALDDEEERHRFFEIFSPIVDMLSVERILKGFDGVNYDNIMPPSDKKTRYGYEFRERKCCDSLFMRMTILPNGEVNACACQLPPLVLGNINEKPLKDIWNKGAHKAYMMAHLKGLKNSIPRCASCESMAYAGHPMDNLDEHMDEILERVVALE